MTKLEEDIQSILDEANTYKSQRERSSRWRMYAVLVLVAALAGAAAGVLTAGLLAHQSGLDHPCNSLSVPRANK